MKSRQSGIHQITRGFFILAAATAAMFLSPAATYSADKNDEYLISLPDKKASSTKPKITTEKKEPAPQPAEPARPISRQSLLSGRASSDSGSAADSAKTSRGGLLRGGPTTGRKNADEVEDEVSSSGRDPNLTRTVSTWSEGSTDYETITEYEGDDEIVTEIVTEHIRGMIVETTTITVTRGGKVVSRSKNKTTRKEESASASTDKQTKAILDRASESNRNSADAPAAKGASKPATGTSTGTTKTQASGKTTSTKNASAEKTTGKTAVEKEKAAESPVETKDETPAESEPEPVQESAEELLEDDYDYSVEPVSLLPSLQEPVQESDPEPAPGTETKKPDYSKQKSSGTVANPFGREHPSGK